MSNNLVHYTREQKLEAATHYAVYGSLAKLERDLDIPKSTSCTWKQNGDDVWVEQVEQIRTQKRDEHIATYTKLASKALKAANKGIANLDTSTLSANDIKSLVVTGATCTDKALLLDGKPTSIKGDSSSTKSVLRFLDQISADYHKQVEIKDSVVSTQEQEE